MFQGGSLVINADYNTSKIQTRNYIFDFATEVIDYTTKSILGEIVGVLGIEAKLI